jgi:hypothetical protein
LTNTYHECPNGGTADQRLAADWRGSIRLASHLYPSAGRSIRKIENIANQSANSAGSCQPGSVFGPTIFPHYSTLLAAACQAAAPLKACCLIFGVHSTRNPSALRPYARRDPHKAQTPPAPTLRKLCRHSQFADFSRKTAAGRTVDRIPAPEPASSTSAPAPLSERPQSSKATHMPRPEPVKRSGSAESVPVEPVSQQALATRLPRPAPPAPAPQSKDRSFGWVRHSWSTPCICGRRLARKIKHWPSFLRCALTPRGGPHPQFELSAICFWICVAIQADI